MLAATWRAREWEREKERDSQTDVQREGGYHRRRRLKLIQNLNTHRAFSHKLAASIPGHPNQLFCIEPSPDEARETHDYSNAQRMHTEGHNNLD